MIIEVFELFYEVIQSAESEDELFTADEIVSPMEILNQPVEVIKALPFSGRFRKECAACLLRLPDGSLRVFFAGTYAKRRPLIAARKNKLPMTMTLGARKALNGRTFYLFDGI